MTQVLELQNVKRAFGTKTVLKGIDLNVAQGELVALYGPSGSGKSTLLNLVGAIDRPSEGVIRLAGRDVARMWEMQRTKLRRREIGFIFQNYPLIASYSASENIDMSLRLKGVSLFERRRRIKASLEAVGLSDHARRLPDQLSGGQQQRVAIARVLALHPTIILADEPTSGLDTRTARRVMKIFQGLAEAEGTAFLVVSHDIDLTERFVNRAYDLRDGQLALRPPVGSEPVHADRGTLMAAFQDETDEWDVDHEPEFLVEVPRPPRPPLVEPDFIADIPRDGRFSADEPEFLAHLPFVAPARPIVVEESAVDASSEDEPYSIADENDDAVDEFRLSLPPELSAELNNATGQNVREQAAESDLDVYPVEERIEEAVHTDESAESDAEDRVEDVVESSDAPNTETDEPLS